MKDYYEDATTGNPALPTKAFECAKNSKVKSKTVGTVEKCYGVYGSGSSSGSGAALTDSIFKNLFSVSSGDSKESGNQMIYPTVPKFYRFCMPDPDSLSAIFGTAIKTVNDKMTNLDQLNEGIEDIKTCWKVIVGSFGIALVIGFVWMIVMKMCAAIITWAIIFAFIGLLGLCTWLVWKKSEDRQKEIDAMLDQSKKDDEYNYFKWGFYAMCGFDAIFLISLLCMYKRIKTAIKIMECAADFVSEVWGIVFVPVVMIVIVLAWNAVFFGIGMYVYAQGKFSAA